jgi:hypothetical protein
MEQGGDGRTRRLSGAVFDRGCVGNTNPRPPLDEGRAMGVVRRDGLCELDLQLDLGLDARLCGNVAKNKLQTGALRQYHKPNNTENGHGSEGGRWVNGRRLRSVEEGGGWESSLKLLGWRFGLESRGLGVVREEVVLVLWIRMTIE